MLKYRYIDAKMSSRFLSADGLRKKSVLNGLFWKPSFSWIEIELLLNTSYAEKTWVLV